MTADGPVPGSLIYRPGEAFDASEGLLTPVEVADMYRVGKETVWEWCRLGLVPHIVTPGGREYRLSVAYHRKAHEESGRGA